MGSFKNPTKTVRVEITQNEWVEIKKELSFSDAMKLARFEKMKGDELLQKFEEFVEVMSGFILNWQVYDSDGVEVPCTKENRVHLDPPAFLLILEKFKELNAVNKEDVESQKKNLPILNEPSTEQPNPLMTEQMS